MRHLLLPKLCAACLCLCALLAACGDDPPVAGFNHLPAVHVWVTVDTTTTPHRADVAWQGIDLDGIVVGYLYGFVPVSGIRGCGEHWNPVRDGDRPFARYTTRTDTTIWLGDTGGIATADAAGGFSRYLFVITAVDDAGGVGPQPSCVELSPAPKFEAPTTYFTLHLGQEARPVDPAAPPDTVGMFRPFSVSYHSRTINGAVGLYRWNVDSEHWRRFPGEGRWSDDLGDTMRHYNLPSQYSLEPGEFRLVVEAMDQIGMQQREQGDAVSSSDTCRVVVNFPPRTRLLAVENRFRVGEQAWDERAIDFQDAQPDTVAMGSWVRLTYQGRDDPRDMLDPELTRGGISHFQVRYQRESGRISGSTDASPWLDNYNIYHASHDLPADSNSFNLGSLEYQFSARALDGWGTPDIDGVSVSIVGNFNPAMDAFSVEDQDGRVMSPSRTDTLTWNWWEPANTDTIVSWGDGDVRKKTFRFRLRASGHDDVRDGPGAAVRSWGYDVRSNAGTSGERFWHLGSAGAWVDTQVPDQLDEVVEVTFYTDIADIAGDHVFDRLPGYLGRDLTVRVVGRDTHTNWREPRFEQYVILGGGWDLQNSFAAADYGRWTAERQVAFHLRMVR